MKRFFQTRILTLLFVMMLCASFAAGYRNGNESRKEKINAKFDELTQLIENTVVRDTWVPLGGASTMTPYPQNLTVCVSGGTDLNNPDSELSPVELVSPEEVTRVENRVTKTGK